MVLNESGSLRRPAALLESEPAIAAAADSTNSIKMPGTDSGAHGHRSREEQPAALQNGDKQIRNHVLVKAQREQSGAEAVAGGDT